MINQFILTITSMKKALFLFKDKWIFILSMIPVLIGSILYYFLGYWLYGDLLTKSKEWLTGYLSNTLGIEVFYWLIVALTTITLFFVINFTFVLLVSLIASPFNDMISSRTEKLLTGKTSEDFEKTFSATFKRYASIIFNEIKKVIFILTLTIFSLFIGLIPGGQIGTIIISAILLAIQFVDYSWSRKELGLGGCIKDLANNFLSYFLSGALMLVLIGVPIINLLALPFGVVFLTVIFVEKRKALS
ncbi:MAG: hypothetical protein DRQ88_07160 [Epsilonproteobacteria bacterium]|nr:MAG: hypothetical protein DRQ89_03255 [Campylobacterota bacterium]RLA66261.1 MAG: hypothetical protein DRQ88_07160 [Campylobacterota bacterium]